MRKFDVILIIAIAIVLAAPCIALADKKKVNSKSDTPTESVTLTYTKPVLTYKAQKGNHKSPAPSTRVKDSHDRY